MVCTGCCITVVFFLFTSNSGAVIRRPIITSIEQTVLIAIVCLAADSWLIRKAWSLRKGRGCKSRKRKAGCSRKYEQPFSHK